MRVEIYTKSDCPLCEEAKVVLRQVQKEIPFAWEEVDIETDSALYERYRYDIPVIAIDGHRAFKHRVEARSLAARLQRARGT